MHLAGEEGGTKELSGETGLLDQLKKNTLYRWSPPKKKGRFVFPVGRTKKNEGEGGATGQTKKKKL